MFLLLVACGAIYLLLGDRHEAAMLLGFVLVVIAITFIQQRRSERSLEALRDLSSPRAMVVRDGVACRVAGRELVVGDVVLLAEGDRVPADLQLLMVANLSVDESLLSGESAPVAKRGGSAVGPSTAAGESSQATHAFAGTLVTQGTARGLVVATGPHSALGRIGQSLQAIAIERTPVQRETQRVVRWVATVGLTLAAGLALAYGVTRGDWLHGLLAGLTLAMAILPEELPVVLTIFLGLGAWRLAREKVLTRSVPAVELLGATTVLCVDKTGTLTMNRMAVSRLWAADTEFDSRCTGAAVLPEALHPLLEFALLASHQRSFDPMEAAIDAAGQRWLAGTEHLHDDWTLVDDYPLSREMLAMSRVWQSPDRQERLIAAKGAPEAVADLCHLDGAQSERIAAQVATMARDGLRVLAVARAVFAAGSLPDTQHDFDFEWLGLVAFEDPLRPDVVQAIAECRGAGIRVVMITGDHPQTALSIARQAGLVVDGGCLTGTQLDTLRRRGPGRAVGRHAGLLPRPAGAEAAPGAGLQGPRRGGGDDRRRRQRRAGAEGGAHRRGDGGARHRRGARSRRTGLAERRLRLAGHGRAPRPPRLRQPAQGDHLRAGGARADRRPVDRAAAARLAAGADAGAHPVPATDHRPGLLGGLRSRAARGRCDARPAAPARRAPVRSRSAGARAWRKGWAC